VTVLQTPFVVMVIASWLAAPAHSLNEVAQKEAFRRQLLPKAQVSVSGTGMPGGMVPPSQPAAPAAGQPAAAAAPASGSPAVEHKNDEAWWRQRIGDARTTLDKDQTSLSALQGRINVLQRDVVNVDNPVQQGKLREELTSTLAQLEKAKAQIATDQNAIQAIQDEARRMDVPAGWVR
jgi:hypothetical protein